VTPECIRAADANNSGAVDISDGVYTLNFLFTGGLAPPAPYPDCGPGAAEGGLECESSPGCVF
jgi:hypothetical protein